MRLEHLLSGESGVFDAARPKLHAEVNGQKEHLLSGVAVYVVYDGDFHVGLHVVPMMSPGTCFLLFFRVVRFLYVWRARGAADVHPL